MFVHLKECADLGNVVILPTIKDNFDPMERIDAILNKAVGTYDRFSTAQLLNKTTKGGRHLANFLLAGIVASQVVQYAAVLSPSIKPELTGPRKSGKRAGILVSRQSGGGGDDKGHPDKPSGPDYQHKKWGSAGIHLVDNILMIKCKNCGLIRTHGNWPSLRIYGKQGFF